MFMVPAKDQLRVGRAIGVMSTPVPIDHEPLRGEESKGFEGTASEPGT